MSSPPVQSLLLMASGRGSNVEAIIEAVSSGQIKATITGVVSDRAKAPVLQIAQRHQIPTRVIRPRDFQRREAWDQAMADAVSELGGDLIVLAGFMRIVGAKLLSVRSNRIINVHPSLLPSFRGAHAAADAVAAGVKISGCTVHLVDSGVDSGRILAQAAVPVGPNDDEATLHQRIQSVEHRLLPTVIEWITSGSIDLDDSSSESLAQNATAVLLSPDPADQ